MQRTLRKTVHGLVFRYHRWLGLLSAITLILWGISGVMHPIMSRLNPAAAAPMPPSLPLASTAVLSLPEVMSRQQWPVIRSARLIYWRGQNVWQIGLPEQPEKAYVAAASGDRLPGSDAAYALDLARHFSGDQTSPVSKVELVTRFDDDYLAVNRLLPVYRVQLNRPDGLRIYVETQPGRLAALVDDRKALLGQWFRWLHNWSFLDAYPALQTGLMMVLLTLALVAALSGLWMYGLMWQRHTLKKTRSAMRRWHRRIGLTTALALILFVVTGILHLWLLPTPGNPMQHQATFQAADLRALALPPSQGLREINLLPVDGVACWTLSATRMATHQPARGEHDHSRHAGASPWPWTVSCPGSDHPSEHLLQNSARHLASTRLGLPESSIQGYRQVKQFAGEYGFLNKRLPVIAIDYATPQRHSVYVEPHTGTIAAVVTTPDRIEGYAFSWLHKFHFLDFAGKDIRDLLNGLFGLGNALVGLMGLWLFARRYR